MAEAWKGTGPGEGRMHELAVTESILNVVLRHAGQNGVRRVLGIALRIGELSDLEDTWLQRYFDYLSKDTLAAGARLHIERVPVVFRCEPCRHDFPVNVREMDQVRCPRCGGERMTLVSGREYFIKNIEVI